MASLLYFLIFAGLFAVMMRFGCGSHVMGHGHGSAKQAPTESAEGNIVRDPVCGMTVDTAKSVTSIHAGKTYYFCSVACRERFAASPEMFISNSQKPAGGREISHASHQR